MLRKIPESFEDRTKSSNLVQSEKEAHDDTNIPPPSDDEGDDKVINNVINNFVDDVGQE